MTKKRGSKRVTWKPENDTASAQPEPDAEVFSVSKEDEGASSRAESNDDRLRADKPPHWG